MTCLEALTSWFGTSMYEQGAAMGREVRWIAGTMDMSLSGWGALCNGKPAFGMWARDQPLADKLLGDGSCSVGAAELSSVCEMRWWHTSIAREECGYAPCRAWKNACSCRQMGYLSIRAVHASGSLNRGANMLSREGIVHGEWRLHPQTVKLIWSLFGEAEIDLFALEENAHCPLYFSLTTSTLKGDALSSCCPPSGIYIPPGQNNAASAAKDQRGEGCCASGGAEMAQPTLVSRVGKPVVNP